jgi:hypothetical protein
MVKYLFKHILIDTIYFPIWWYTAGFLKVLQWSKKSMQKAERVAALKIWLKSMFKPMFQDYTKEGRIVSFFMRIVLLIFKLVMVGLWAMVLLGVILLWLTIPVITILLLLVSVGYNITELVSFFK